jgi:hypothetical protein
MGYIDSMMICNVIQFNFFPFLLYLKPFSRGIAHYNPCRVVCRGDPLDPPKKRLRSFCFAPGISQQKQDPAPRIMRGVRGFLSVKKSNKIDFFDGKKHILLFDKKRQKFVAILNSIY